MQSLLLLTILTVPLVLCQRQCEREGSCRNCGASNGQLRFSYYKCQGQSDCYATETCSSGFCCPRDVTGTGGTGTGGTGVTSAQKCPDGTYSSKVCNNGFQCNALSETCSQGRCCPSCQARRQKAQSIDLTQYIPECELDGKLFLAVQCHAGVCWCATKNGEQIPGTKPTGSKDCVHERFRHEKGNGDATTGGSSSSSTTTTSTTTTSATTSGNSVTVVSAEIAAKVSESGSSQCTYTRPGTCPIVGFYNSVQTHSCTCDSECTGNQKCCQLSSGRSCVTPSSTGGGTSFCKQNEVVNNCHNPCQPYCAQPNRPSCPTLRCSRGCHCAPGYIRQTSDQNSACVLTSQCSTTGVISSCNDPYKIFQTCGTACPIGCDNVNNPPGICTANCVRGCFCRAPYIFRDSKNWLTSQCVLQTSCATTTTTGTTCSDLRKQYQQCGSACPPGCNARSRTCIQRCTAGCFCRSPYLLQDAYNANSRCVLTSECVTQDRCNDATKEYRTCGSACPLGCNDLSPKTCSPCQSGCFCRSGYVFEDSTNWRNSRCVLRSQCPTTTNDGTHAVVELQNANFGQSVTGTLNMKKEGSGIRVTGSVYGVTDGQHSLAVNQFGVTKGNCQNVGSIRRDLGNHYANFKNMNINQLVSGVTIDAVAGRALVVYQGSSINAGQPIACGIIGISRGF